VHATRLARELGISTVLVPKAPGVLFSLGLLVSDLETSFSLTPLCRRAEDSAADIEAAFDVLDGKARAWFDREEVAAADRAVAYSVDMRYAGQGHELNVASTPTGDAGALIAELRRGFEQIHRQMYGYTAPEEAIQITTFRAE